MNKGGWFQFPPSAGRKNILGKLCQAEDFGDLHGHMDNGFMCEEIL